MPGSPVTARPHDQDRVLYDEDDPEWRRLALEAQRRRPVAGLRRHRRQAQAGPRHPVVGGQPQPPGRPAGLWNMITKAKTDPRDIAPLRDAIRRRINELGITQAEAAERIGIERRLSTHYQNSLRTMLGPEQWLGLVEGLGLAGEELPRRLSYLPQMTDHRVLRLW